MKVEFAKRALSDLRQIAEYHNRADSPALGARIEAGIKRTVTRVARAPESGRPVSQRSGVRVAPLLRYRYLIFYRVGEDTIRILHIRHMARRPWVGG
ncbi:MAG TPA: type II toxin-antitoxin system RelE/ParE family toxin [Stellaceae bacterium]|nr:type II toxin-antitoxin system RelE/ParE family toxin [Stellaceae bacterium]